eukprot:TRINITY_DN21957_c0_g1_i1.p1 TRINITY_DN21957_c0_g1~~TRINITY_DN21957_c0_g1_i1.p1  ORF type:complete len:525 (+),score=92.60 TRINITY_DN21957_c0_g1_i1:98-1672(+)
MSWRRLQVQLVAGIATTRISRAGEELSCFGEDGFTFDLCCDQQQYGPGGNSECWDKTYTFEVCCSPHSRSFEGSTCWSTPAARIKANRHEVAYPYLKDEASIKEFCCGLMHNGICWGDRPEQMLHDDSPERVGLGFTSDYVRCCFADLQAMIRHSSPPAWMASSVSQDMAHFHAKKARLRKADIDAFEASLSSSVRAKFCRFSIGQDGSINHCDFFVSRYFVLLEQVRNALHVLRRLTALPEVDFLVYVDEAACLGKRPLGDHLTNDFPVPVFVQAKPRRGCAGSILMPWWAFLNMDWARRYPTMLSKESAEIPWNKRAARLFWRGSDTGCLLPGACGLPRMRRGRSAEVNRTCDCSRWNISTWHLFPRSRLTMMSTMYSVVDAKFTKDIVHEDCSQAYKDGRMHVGEIVPPKDHLWYRYLMYIDGLSFSDRLCWLLHSGAAVFKAESNLRVWLDRGLRPRVHYVPIKEDLQDLVDVLRWAEENDAEVERIALAGQKFAEAELSLDASMYYLHYLLTSYAELFA